MATASMQVSPNGPSWRRTNERRILYGKKDAAKLLSISIRKLEYLIRKGEIVVRRVDRRVLVSYEELLRFARQDDNEANTTHGTALA